MLETTISNPGNLENNITKFQEIIWNEELDCTAAQEEILGDLAYNLDFYVTNSESRKEDPSYYGEDKAIKKIKDALSKIKMF